jgi:oligoendopeptidase F
MPSQKIPERSDIADEHKWDLNALFESDKSWERMLADIEAELASYTEYKGRLKDSAALFQEALEYHLGLTRKLERVYTYAHT